MESNLLKDFETQDKYNNLSFNINTYISAGTEKSLKEQLSNEKISKDVKYIIITLRSEFGSDSRNNLSSLYIPLTFNIDGFRTFTTKEEFDEYIENELDTQLYLTFEVKEGKIVLEDN